MNACFSCGRSLEGVVFGGPAGHPGWFCIDCLMNLLGLPKGGGKGPGAGTTGHAGLDGLNCRKKGDLKGDTAEKGMGGVR